MAIVMPTGPRFQNLIGYEFGRLVVLGYAGKQGASHCWLCRCKCGTEKTVTGSNLRSGRTKSCGCFKREEQRRKMLANFIGQSFFRLTVLKYICMKGTAYYFLCRCKCGTEKVVATSNLKSGRTKSCGCYHREQVSKRFSK